MTKFWWNLIMRWAKEWELCRREEREEEEKEKRRNFFVFPWRLVPRCLVPSWISCFYWFWPSVLVAKGTWACTGHAVPEDGKGRGHSHHLDFSSEKWNSLQLQSPLCSQITPSPPALSYFRICCLGRWWLHSWKVQIWILALANRSKTCYQIKIVALFLEDKICSQSTIGQCSHMTVKA